MGFDAAPGPDWVEVERLYLAARRLEHPDGLTAPEVCEALAAEAWPRPDADAAQAVLAEALAAPADLTLVQLNALGLLALRVGAWEAAAALASEVTARSHHDLLAQRIFDAASEQSDMLETPVDAWLADRTCPAPFEELETRENGDVHFCCSAWQPVPIGRLKEGSAVWTSARAQEIRRSVSDGDFSHCSRWHCPRIADRRLPRRGDPASPPPEGPRRVILSHDRSCNLACPSCRTQKILLDHARSAHLDRMVNGTMREMLARAETIKVTGSGDPFGSRHFRNLIRDLPRRGRTRWLQLQTNGLLFDQRAWEDLNLWDQVASVWVSVDASRSGTYATLRGGSFDQLLENLRFLGAMRRAGALPFLRLDVVVQRDNFEEVPEVIDMANRIGADGVYLLRLRNWGTFTVEEFRERDVCHPAHPEHRELLARLADPRLISPGVELGSLAPLVEQARACAA